MNFEFQFRNQYDSDVTTWSPQGRLHQVEYAMEAVKQGSATVGVKSKTHAVLVAFKRRPSELAAYQKKVRKRRDHFKNDESRETSQKTIFVRLLGQSTNVES